MMGGRLALTFSSFLSFFKLDPSKVNADEVKRHTSKFIKLVDRLVDDICKSASKCPMYVHTLSLFFF